MRKFTLFVAVILIAFNTMAQDKKVSNTKLRKLPPLIQKQLPMQAPFMNNGMAPLTTIFSQDFASGIPANWVITDNIGFGMIWSYAMGPQGGSATTGDTLKSPTASNGFAIADDDAFVETVTHDRSTDLITPPINCSAYANVHISFTDYFIPFNTGVGTLSISVDGGLSWFDIFLVDYDEINPTLHDINVTAYAANQSDVRFKFNYFGQWDLWWQIDDIFVFEPLPFDGSIISIETASTACNLTSAEPVAINFRNAGINPINSCTASFSVDGGLPVTENVSTVINTGDTLNFPFAATADLSAFGPHHIKAWINVPSDGNLSNDSTTTTTVNISPFVVNSTDSFTMGFEPNEDLTGWTTLDVNSDGITWDLVNFNPHTGSFSAYAVSNGVDLDDWLFSTCINLQSGTSYTLKYWMNLTGNNASLESYIGLVNSSAMTQRLDSTAGIAGSTYIPVSADFTVPASGTYYIGFRAFEYVLQPGEIKIDDINLGITPASAVKKIKGDANWFELYPNPAADNVTIKLNHPYQNASIEVINILGSVVKSASVESNIKTFDIANLESGIYTLKVSFDGKDVYKRFMIKNGK